MPKEPRYPTIIKDRIDSILPYPRKSSRLSSKQEQKQEEEKLAAAEALLYMSKLPPKIKSAFEDATINSKAESLERKYMTGRTGPDITSPMSIAVWTWGPIATADFLQHRDAVRYMYAPTDNTGQCIRAGLGDPSNPQQALKMKCWLCDFPLINPMTMTKYDAIACEHVLPVFQAVMYADIALANRPSTSTDELVTLEYAWAHTVCNGPKSNRLFIVETKDPSGRFINWRIDREIIKKTLRETIPAIRQKQIDGGVLESESAQTEWINRRLQDIEERLNKILKFLNNPDPGGNRLTKLFSVAKLLDPERWASNVKIDEQAYNQYADRLIKDYDEYMNTIVGDALKNPDVLKEIPGIYTDLSKLDWTKQSAGKRRTKRKGRVTRKRKNNNRR